MVVACTWIVCYRHRFITVHSAVGFLFFVVVAFFFFFFVHVVFAIDINFITAILLVIYVYVVFVIDIT